MAWHWKPAIILFRFLKTNVCWNQSSYAINVPLTFIIFFAKVTTLFLKWKRISLLSNSKALTMELNTRKRYAGTPLICNPKVDPRGEEQVTKHEERIRRRQGLFSGLFVTYLFDCLLLDHLFYLPTNFSTTPWYWENGRRLFFYLGVIMHQSIPPAPRPPPPG